MKVSAWHSGRRRSNDDAIFAVLIFGELRNVIISITYEGHSAGRSREGWKPKAETAPAGSVYDSPVPIHLRWMGTRPGSTLKVGNRAKTIRLHREFRKRTNSSAAGFEVRPLVKVRMLRLITEFIVTAAFCSFLPFARCGAPRRECGDCGHRPIRNVPPLGQFQA